MDNLCLTTLTVNKCTLNKQNQGLSKPLLHTKTDKKSTLIEIYY